MKKPLHFLVPKKIKIFLFLIGNTKVAQILIANGANVNAEDFSGHTPLHSAAKNGNLIYKPVICPVLERKILKNVFKNHIIYFQATTT